MESPALFPFLCLLYDIDDALEPDSLPQGLLLLHLDSN